jgi:hypothetical protein
MLGCILDCNPLRRTARTVTAAEKLAESLVGKGSGERKAHKRSGHETIACTHCKPEGAKRLSKACKR